MASLLALLSQQTPNLQTRKGLIVTGVQNDFASPDGKLFSCSNNSLTSLVQRLQDLAPTFRDLGGDVIWVRTEYEAAREVNVEGDNGDTVIAGRAAAGHGQRDEAARNLKNAIERTSAREAEVDDEELFLTTTAGREPCCVPGSWGADYPDSIKPLIDETKDMQVTKTYYSAFGSTSLLLTLRSRLITELFICGCNTNLSVFATAMDAARYGIKITLIEDCLGYRRKERHDEAIRQLVHAMGARVVSAAKAMDILRNPAEEEEEEDDDDDDEESDEGEAGAFPGDGGFIDVDSDEGGDAEESSVTEVRPSRLPNRSLSLRYRVLRSQDAAASHLKTPAESAKPASSRLSSTSATTVSSGLSNGKLGAHAGRGQPHVKSKIVHSPSSSSVNGYKVAADRVPEAPQKAAPPTKLAHESSKKDTLASNLPWLQLSSAAPKFDTPPGRSSHRGLSALSAVCKLPQSTVTEWEHMMKQEAADRPNRGTSKPLFGDEDESDSASSRIYYDLIPVPLADHIFEELHGEINWQRMHHLSGEVPRLVSCQAGISSEGDKPVYRHPSDQTMPVEPWTSTVNTVRMAAEELVGHPLNHALIQLYRGGTDYISEHSDKTLDIAKGSNIVNVSFGAQRKMKLRTKRGVQPSLSPGTPSSQASERKGFTITMPHNSMIKMSLETNAEYLHGIKADKRLQQEKSDAEKACEGQRISLTFRHIATFLDKDEKVIWGQGAIGKTKEAAQTVINGDVNESARLVKAFGAENAASSIDWDAVYGKGSNVLHLKG